MGVTPAQAALVQKSWAIVAQNLKAHGCDLFCTFFAAYPDYQNQFTRLKGLSGDALKNAPQLKSHVSIIMATLGAIISNLDDPATYDLVIKRIAEDHKPRNVKPEQFVNFGNILIKFLGDKLGGAFDGATKSAWEAAYATIVDVVKATL